jgi:glycosyltransferase involved in cell wall biosynthesis
MKILHVTKRYPNSAGGDGIVVVNLERHQQAAGHTVNILTSNCPDILDKPNVRKFGLPIQSADIDIISPKRMLTMLGMLFFAFRFLRKVKPDVIHSHTMDFGFAVSIAARIYRIPMINTCHGISFADMQFTPAKRGLEKLLLKAAGYRRLITVDPTSLPEFKKAGIGPVVFRGNGVEPSDFKAARPRKPGRFRVLFVGRLNGVKGVPYLLEAMKDIVKAAPETELLMAGDGDRTEEYRQLVKDTGLSKNVTFLGRQSVEQLRKLYTDVDAFVLPSLHEGFPLVTLEAWACSLPVIITRVGAHTEICTHGYDAMLVDIADAPALADAIITVYKDPALAHELGVNGRKLVEERYNYAHVAADMQEIYDEVTA